jgi:hypothetical protein
LWFCYSSINDVGVGVEAQNGGSTTPQQINSSSCLISVYYKATTKFYGVDFMKIVADNDIDISYDYLVADISQSSESAITESKISAYTGLEGIGLVYMPTEILQIFRNSPLFCYDSLAFRS